MNWNRIVSKSLDWIAKTIIGIVIGTMLALLVCLLLSMWKITIVAIPVAALIIWAVIRTVK